MTHLSHSPQDFVLALCSPVGAGTVLGVRKPLIPLQWDHAGRDNLPSCYCCCCLLGWTQLIAGERGARGEPWGREVVRRGHGTWKLSSGVWEKDRIEPWGPGVEIGGGRWGLGSARGSPQGCGETGQVGSEPWALGGSWWRERGDTASPSHLLATSFLPSSPATSLSCG